MNIRKALVVAVALAAPLRAQVYSVPTVGAGPSLAAPLLPATPSSLAPLPSLSLSAPSLNPSLVPSFSPAALRPVHAAPVLPSRQFLAAPPHGVPSVTAYVLDLDGNAFGPGFPTKIILFKKGTSEELPVSTAEFATLEKKLGTDFPYAGVNLADYELRGDASFREFFGPKFAADLQWAVENLPASLWQGPSWGAMVQALSDPRIAPFVYVLTARQHTSEQLLDGFKYLQGRGYIKYQPRVENLHAVGGTYRTAERKAELMAEFADALQAMPYGDDGGPHTIGFSDDTWANFEKMRDSLLAAIRANRSRWSRVKIALFYTGLGDPAHAQEAIVLKNDGTTRPYVPGEPR